MLLDFKIDVTPSSYIGCVMLASGPS